LLVEYKTFTEEIVKAGKHIGGEALKPVESATSVRVREGKRLQTDGPFAETKEQLGGYYLIECDTIEQAVEAAKMCPGAKYGSVEVRPVMQVPARV